MYKIIKNLLEDGYAVTVIHVKATPKKTEVVYPPVQKITAENINTIIPVPEPVKKDTKPKEKKKEPKYYATQADIDKIKEMKEADIPSGEVSKKLNIALSVVNKYWTK